MIMEVSVPVNEGIVISGEADSEMEHEENKEDSKEKTTIRTEFRFSSQSSFLSNGRLISYNSPKWKSPAIDFHTPPPEFL